MGNQAQSFVASESKAGIAPQPLPVTYHLRPAVLLHHRHAKDIAAWLLQLLIEAGSLALLDGGDVASKVGDTVSPLQILKRKSLAAACTFPPQLLRVLVNMASIESRTPPTTCDLQSFAISESGTWLRLIASVLHLSPANSDATVDSWSRKEISRLERRLQQIYTMHTDDSRSVAI